MSSGWESVELRDVLGYSGYSWQCKLVFTLMWERVQFGSKPVIFKKLFLTDDITMPKAVEIAELENVTRVVETCSVVQAVQLNGSKQTYLSCALSIAQMLFG
jgi:hypothetical protein